LNPEADHLVGCNSWAGESGSFSRDPFSQPHKLRDAGKMTAFAHTAAALIHVVNDALPPQPLDQPHAR
jgi:hypothetical protein